MEAGDKSLGAISKRSKPLVAPKPSNSGSEKKQPLSLAQVIQENTAKAQEQLEVVRKTVSDTKKGAVVLPLAETPALPPKQKMVSFDQEAKKGPKPVPNPRGSSLAKKDSPAYDTPRNLK